MKKTSIKVAAISLSLALAQIGFAQTSPNTQPLPGAKVAAQAEVGGISASMFAVGAVVLIGGIFLAVGVNNSGNNVFVPTTATATSTR